MKGFTPRWLAPVGFVQHALPVHVCQHTKLTQTQKCGYPKAGGSTQPNKPVGSLPVHESTGMPIFAFVWSLNAHDSALCCAIAVNVAVAVVLQTLPESLSLLTSLHHLDLSKNRLQQLPPSLTPSLSHLTLLDISGNHLDAAPALDSLKQLQHLSLGLNYLKSMSCSFWKFSGCLVALELPHVASCLPDAWGMFEGLGELTGLTRLNVSCHQLEGVPEAWERQLTQLKVRGSKRRIG